MIDIHLSYTEHIPLYQQIVQRVKQLIATNRLKPGERLPTVRQLADSLHLNQGTVARAYLQLAQEGIIVSRRGGGTIVSAKTDETRVLMLRQGQLSNIVSSSILEALSLGHTPEELEAAFSLHMARWREERQGKEEASRNQQRKFYTRNNVRIVGSDDLALNLLVNRLRQMLPEIDIEVISTGSLNGLIALHEEKADLASIHLLDEETSTYNYPYVKRILPGRKIVIMHLAYRMQGFIFAPGNPKRINGFDDLKRTDVTIVNRQKSSGTRILLDLTLHRMDIPVTEVKGYQQELDTHLAIAHSIAQGKADVGLGIEAAARSYGLGFLPLFREKYDIVAPAEKCQDKVVSSLLETIKGVDFKKAVDEMGGYDTSETGATSIVK